MNTKTANTDVPIHELLQKRWSPRAFSSKPVEREKILSLLEAARWTPSSYNEQPWKYLVVLQQDSEAFQQLLASLNERNRQWAQHAPLLMVSIAKLHLNKTGAKNSYAWYDLGQATANLTVQATSMGLFIHQMGGFDQDKLQSAFNIPDSHEPVAVMAIGYLGDVNMLPENLQHIETKARNRNPIADFAFCNTWDEPVTFSFMNETSLT